VSTPEEFAAQPDAVVHGLHNTRRLASNGGRDAFDARAAPSPLLGERG